MAGEGYSAMVLGATGNVGGRIVRLLVDSERCRRIVLVARRSTGIAHAKITERVVDMERLEEQVHESHVDVALAAFGVGKGSAKMSEDEVRRIEVAIPRAFCRAAKAAGARVCALMSAGGANPSSSSRYVRLMGEKERAVQELGFDALGLFRPGVILGNSNTPALLGRVMPFVDAVLPSKYRSVHKDDLARAMVAWSEQAVDAAAGSAPAVQVLEYREMAPYFVAGDRNARA